MPAPSRRLFAVLFAGFAIGHAVASPALSPEWADITPPGTATLSRIAAHPLEPGVIAAFGGNFVHASRDGGLTWITTLPFQYGLKSVFTHAGRPGLLLADTKLAASEYGLIIGGGRLFESRDFGASWITANDDPNERSTVFGSDPRNGARLFGVYNTYTLCLPPGDCTEHYRLNFRESTNGGATWQDLSRVGTLHGSSSALNATPPVPSSPERIVATTASGAYISRDAARTWSPFAAALGSGVRWIVADPTAANFLYALRTGNGGTSLLRSDDDGGTWRLLVAKDGDTATREPKLVIDPTDSRRLWLTGFQEGAFFSGNRGESWHHLGFAAQAPDAPAHDLALSPADPWVVYLVHENRLYRGNFRRPEITPAIEFYLPSQDKYWIATKPSEALVMDYGVDNAPWVRTGREFLVWPGDSYPEWKGVCRFQGRSEYGLRTRFLTLEGGECEAVTRSPAWNLETQSAFRAAMPGSNRSCPEGTSPVRRFYNGRADVNHRYTTDDATAGEMRARGWIDENVVMCVPASR